MQYWKPDGAFFVGDCIPFCHDGVYHLFYLLDENHHQGLGGMGGHQWAHATTSDLVHWQHHPLALAIDEEWERSICTGTPYFHDGRLLTLEDTVEFFNLILELKLNGDEKSSLVAFLRQL
jgi:hypothetical protein